MGKKQITKTVRQKKQRIKRLVGMGQPVIKTHVDKYADKTRLSERNALYEDQQRTDISSIDSEQQPKIDHQYKIDNYRSTLYFLFDRINSHAIRKEYDEGLDVIKTVRSLLKRDLFSQLNEHERSNMRDSVYSLENLCLAGKSDPITSQTFSESVDLIYLMHLKKNGRVIPPDEGYDRDFIERWKRL